MSALLYSLRRHRDVSGVSGTGDVATVCEFDSGLTVMHWDSPTPSVAVYTDSRHIEDLHGHGGASTLELNDKDRLLKAYEQLTPLLLQATGVRPTTIGRHPDHPDRLRVTFSMFACWDRWVSALGGSLDAATHEEVNGEMRHTWVSPDGNLWLVYYAPLPKRDEYPDHDAHDLRD